MIVVRYDRVEKPVSSAVQIGNSPNWYIMNPEEKDDLPQEAMILPAQAKGLAVQRSKPLPKDHPLHGENVPDGPFPAGSLPGDLRFNNDGSTDYYHVKDGVGSWIPYTDLEGDYILPTGE